MEAATKDKESTKNRCFLSRAFCDEEENAYYAANIVVVRLQ